MRKIFTLFCLFLFVFTMAVPRTCYADDDADKKASFCQQFVGSDPSRMLTNAQCLSYWEGVAIGGVTGTLFVGLWNNCFCTVPAFRRNLRTFSGGDKFCWFCRLIAVIYNEGMRMATKFVYELKDLFIDLLSLGVLFFIVFKVGKMVAGFKETGTAAFATEIFKPLLRAIFAFILLETITYLFEWIVEPFLNLTDGLTATVLVEGGASSVKNASFPASDFVKWTQEIDIPSPDDPTKPISALNLDVCKNLKTLLGEKNYEIKPVQTSDGDKKPLINEEYRDAMLLTPLCYASAHLVTGISMGLAFVNSGFGSITAKGMPSVYLLLVGGLLFLAYFMIMLAIPFKMIDATLQLIFVVLLSPFFIILWVFPVTVSYAKKGWDMFLSSCVTLFILFFMMMLVLNLLDYTIANKRGVFDALKKGDMEAATEAASLSSSDLLITIAMGLLCAKLIGMAPALANALVGNSPDLKVGDSLQKQVFSLGATLGGGIGRAGSAIGLGPGA